MMRLIGNNYRLFLLNFNTAGKSSEDTYEV